MRVPKGPHVSSPGWSEAEPGVRGHKRNPAPQGPYPPVSVWCQNSTPDRFEILAKNKGLNRWECVDPILHYRFGPFRANF